MHQTVHQLKRYHVGVGAAQPEVAPRDERYRQVVIEMKARDLVVLLAQHKEHLNNKTMGIKTDPLEA